MNPNHEPSGAPTTLHYANPGPVRCTCGAFICRTCAASEVEVKCRRCKRLLHIIVKAAP